MAGGNAGIVQIKKNGKPLKDHQGRSVWEIRLSLGRNPINGKYETVTRRVHGTKSDARKVREEMRLQSCRGVDLSLGKVLLGEFADSWLVGRIGMGDLSESTVVRYGQLVRQLKEYIGHVPVCDVTPLVVDGFYQALKTDRGLSNASVRKMHCVLRQIMEQACSYDILIRNPCERVRLSRLDQVERGSLSVESARRLLKAIDRAESLAYLEEREKEHRQRFVRGELREYIRGMTDIACVLAARLGLATGARRGEVLALRWKNVDFDEGVVSIDSSLTSKGAVKCPKSKAGIRTIALDDVTLEAFRKWKIIQSCELRKIGFEVDGETPVFSNAKGGFLNPHNFSRWWRGFVGENGFDGLKFHELRHTQATLLLAQGVDVKTVQTRLGHANASITLNWYAHAVPENDHAAAKGFAELIGE